MYSQQQNNPHTCASYRYLMRIIYIYIYYMYIIYIYTLHNKTILHRTYGGQPLLGGLC